MTDEGYPEFDTFKIFIYHKSLEKARGFYRDILGLEETHESDHVKQYWMSPNVAVGVVLDGHGYLPATEDKPVMLCFHVPDDGDIYELFGYLKGKGVKMLDEGVREFSAGGWVFLCEDPEGYVVEFVKRP
ncbi:VOC family protein [Candidatus Bathyarchaeota archaeon]|nr:VOC family protein [Candidatus Bathyarchaeota archaeon]